MTRGWTAAGLIEFLTDPGNAALMKAKGMEPD
jgi:hypothetical protein